MDYYTIDKLPYPRHIGIRHAKKFTLDKPFIRMRGYTSINVSAGTEVNLYQSKNFGVVSWTQDGKRQTERY